MNAYEVYLMYLALKRHFTSDYDYFKFNGKVKSSVDAFEKRKDKFFFIKLSKHSNPLEYFLSNIIIKHEIWIGDLVNDSNCKTIYSDWMKRKESLSYTLKEDLLKLSENFSSNFDVIDQSYPEIIQLYLSKKICIETVALMERYVVFLDKAKSKLNDTIIFPGICRTIQKYEPFVVIDDKKTKKMIVNMFSGI